MSNSKNNILRFCFLMVAFFAILFFIYPVSADGVPENGTFLGQTGWAFTKGGSVAEYDATVGHDASGSAKLNCGSAVESMSFLATTGSSLSFYAKTSVDLNRFDGQIRDYDYNTVTDIFVDTQLHDDWEQLTFSLAGFAGSRITFWFAPVDCGSVFWLDDVTVSNAVDLGPIGQGQVNGTFHASGMNWVGANWTSSQGHNANGAIIVSGGNTTFGALTPAFDLDSADWSIWGQDWCSGGTATLAVQIVDVDHSSGTGFVSVLSSQTISSDCAWHEYEFDVTAYVGHRVKFLVLYRNALADDLCSASYCFEGTVTPTPTVTNTAVPSSTAVPTNTPEPTWTPNINNPTPIYGPGTSVPVAIGTICPPSNPCYVAVTTPLAVDLVGVGGTPISAGGAIPIQGGNSTPVNVQFATPVVTSVSAAAVSVGGAASVFRSADVSGVMPIGGADGSVGSVVGVDVDRNDVEGCLPGQVASAINTDGNDCVSVPVYTVSQYNLLGVDLLPLFGVVMVALFVVFIIRQLQER